MGIHLLQEFKFSTSTISENYMIFQFLVILRPSLHYSLISFCYHLSGLFIGLVWSVWYKLLPSGQCASNSSTPYFLIILLPHKFHYLHQHLKTLCFGVQFCVWKYQQNYSKSSKPNWITRPLSFLKIFKLNL